MSMSTTTPVPSTPTRTDDPLWYKDAVIYQIHVKSFFDGNNDGIGDFRGLLEKLDYIADLGVTAVWMLPFYPSPRRDDGYDISDYRDVSPDYGSIEQLREFVGRAHELGLKVITELVINHTSDQHPWFQRARRAPKGSEERDFYVWSDNDDKYGETRIIFLDTEKSNWAWDDVAGAYYWHRFYSHQPDLNFDNPAVLEEVLSVMRFWVDLGIDGLRLDAVPYLVERDGTTNENLPETHVVIKRIRAELERYAPGVMLLAEANMWPEDVQAYFGDGDECHMAFHFPLMPRMYMAIAREDRFPITDIMRQTPEIPSNCQWAIFLRNHDELTLEMVTSSERDYLWETYASDRRARINLGIRRRLAPLMQRDRRRIELMNGLLLSMPGTPVIYYGDEIGMGDNIHLGDRDGVRTPMQWSVDRNGGFSRADPASLVLPPLLDPIYGYFALNVEAQANDSHSLLNWARRMLAVRRRHIAFGRGTQRFLYPQNRKVLAYLREYHDGDSETILCVSNLSRTAQAVELDLHNHEGRIPVDVVGGSIFPAVGHLTYLLTLPPYAFYWFLLAEKEALPDWHAPNSEPLPELQTLVVRNSVAEIFENGKLLNALQSVLPEYLRKRRWFGSKSETIDELVIDYAVPLDRRRNNRVALTEIRARIGDRTENYVVPLGAVPESVTNPLVQQLALSRIRRVALVGFLTDGFASDDFTIALLDLIRREERLPVPGGGEVQFRKGPTFDGLDLPEQLEIRRLSAEQSNSSQIISDLLVLKIIRKVLAGVHPEGEMTGYLTERGFTNTAPLFGEVVRVDTDGTPHTLILLQGFVRNQGDGWGWTLDYLARVTDDIGMQEAPEGAEALAEHYEGYLPFATAVGKRLAELHDILSTSTGHQDFEPRTARRADLDTWAEGAIAQLDSAVVQLERFLSGDTSAAETATIEMADRTVQRAASLRDVVRGLAMHGEGALATRVHGDFHLGQVLVVGGDAFLIDFEGEPAKTMDERRAHSCPLRDVAGMMRSFDYAASTAEIRARAAPGLGAERQLVALAAFREIATAAFAGAYNDVLAASTHPWVSPGAQSALLDLFLIEKAAYEIRYEVSNRPTWLPIPLRGLDDIATRLLGG